jgi:hypothetical protein
MKARAPRYPFPFVGEGIATARKALSVFVVFARPRVRQPSGVLPKVFTFRKQHSPVVLEAGHVGELAWAVARSYGRPGPRAEHGDASVAQWTTFGKDISRWLRALHEVAPIAFVVLPADDEYGTSFGRWHTWSSLRAGPEGAWGTAVRALVAKGAPRGLRGVARWVFDQYRRDLAMLAEDEQRAKLDALPAEARRLLARHGGIPDVVAAAPDPATPSLATMRAAFATVRGQDGDREERFKHALDAPQDDSGPSLWDFATTLDEQGHRGEAADVCLEALRGPVEYPDHWHNLVIQMLVQAGRHDEARARLPAALLHTPLYASERLMPAWIELLDAAGRQLDAAAVFHGAAKHISYFSSLADGAGAERAKLTRASAALRRRFAELWREAVQPAWQLTTLSDDALWNATSNAGKVGCSDLAAAASSERERRAAERLGRLEDDGEVEAGTFVAPPFDTATEAQFDRVLATLPQLDEVSAEKMFAWAYSAADEDEGRERKVYQALTRSRPPAKKARRYHWLMDLNNAIIMTWRRKQLDLSLQLVELAAPHAHENPHLFHAAACTYVSLGRLDEAFAQVVGAVEHRYSELAALKRDTDLGPLLTWPTFKALFASRRT